MAETASVGPQVTRVRACELYDNGAGTTQTISEKSAFLNRLVTKEARGGECGGVWWEAPEFKCDLILQQFALFKSPAC